MRVKQICFKFINFQFLFLQIMIKQAKFAIQMK